MMTKRRWSRRGRRHRRGRGRGCSPKYRCRDSVDADADTDADTLTRQQTWELRSRRVSEQAFFFLTFGTVLDTLRRHGHCVFLR